MDAGSYMAQWSLLRSLAWAGEHAQVLELAPAHLVVSGRHLWTLGALAMGYAAAGRPDLVRAVHDELDARARMEFIAPAWRAAVAAAAGLVDEGMGLLETAVEERDPFCIFMNAMPVWGPLRGHPGYPALVAKMGFLDAGR